MDEALDEERVCERRGRGEVCGGRVVERRAGVGKEVSGLEDGLVAGDYERPEVADALGGEQIAHAQVGEDELEEFDCLEDAGCGGGGGWFGVRWERV